MRALVTGGTGFIGSNLVLKLIESEHDVIMTGHHAEQIIPNFKKGIYFQGDLTNIKWDFINHVDVLFHQAAINDTTSMNRREMLKVNVEKSKEIFQRAIDHGCKRIVYASSTAVYGNLPAPYTEDIKLAPLNPYGESKELLEEFATDFSARHKEIVVVGLRYSNVYGPRENHKGKRASMIYKLAQMMMTGNPRHYKFGEAKRDFTYVKDVVMANLLASQSRESCIVNCGSGKATSFNRLVEIINKVLGTSRVSEYIENPYNEMYQNFTLCDMSRAREKIGFIPEYDIEKGIRDYHESGFLVTR
ncbi:NAD-dependent epimerase/dehydratase family protein [Candidatus Woesearchaeota archaeon]|nr:NAD-dependent epimerase/dehydratase family protein [Candidatus Woesearchaeota archaeon]